MKLSFMLAVLLVIRLHAGHHANLPLQQGIIDVDAIVSVLKKHSTDVIASEEVNVKTKRS